MMALKEITLKKCREANRCKITEFRWRSLLNINYRAHIPRIAAHFYTNPTLQKNANSPTTNEISGHILAKKQAYRPHQYIDRDFFLSVLGSSATKRETRSYLQRYGPVVKASIQVQDTPHSKSSSVIQGSSSLSQEKIQGASHVVPEICESNSLRNRTAKTQLHVALIKIRAAHDLDNIIVNGIGRTLSQLGKLGLMSIIVVDCDDGLNHSRRGGVNWRTFMSQQARRIATAIDSNGMSRARLVDNAVGVCIPNDTHTSPQIQPGYIKITGRDFILTPLTQGIIPVIPAIGYTEDTLVAVPTIASDILVALAKEFIDHPETISPTSGQSLFHHSIPSCPNPISIDRLIILDPLGGVPTHGRTNDYHVFLNMEQEYEHVKADLLSLRYTQLNRTLTMQSKMVESDGCFPGSTAVQKKAKILKEQEIQQKNHLSNLNLMREILAILSPSSSALLTTPEAAIGPQNEPNSSFQVSEVATRRQRNPLIYNLLTDKPLFSSTLPTSRLRPLVGNNDIESTISAANVIPTTFAKHGMPLRIFPDPQTESWRRPEPGKPQFTLQDSGIDLPRLLYLIEDSFDRKLDVESYLRRVDTQIAGVIVAGDYEGGALLTWEMPPGIKNDGSLGSISRMVPYLDKFAVLKRSQGSAGVADVVFRAMVRDCFPSGVCWRSRNENPVNKWYFERSRGTWRIPDTSWSMFWTTPELSINQDAFHDYVAVCKAIEPTWIDILS